MSLQCPKNQLQTKIHGINSHLLIQSKQETTYYDVTPDHITLTVGIFLKKILIEIASMGLVCCERWPGRAGWGCSQCCAQGGACIPKWSEFPLDTSLWDRLPATEHRRQPSGSPDCLHTRHRVSEKNPLKLQ